MYPLTVLHIFSGDLWAGAEVMVFALLKKMNNASNLKIIALGLNEGVLTEKLKNAGIEVYVIPEGVYSLPVIVMKAYQLFKHRKINLIHSHRYKENFIALFLAKLIGVKRLVTTIHGLPESQLEKNSSRQSLTWAHKFNYFLLKRFFSDIVAVSREMKEALVNGQQLDLNKTKVIYNGISIPDDEKYFSRLSEPKIHIGTVGRLVAVKDFDLFLEIAAVVKNKFNNISFSILGDGPLKKRLLRKAKELNIDDSVCFLSPIQNPYPYYQSLDIYLNTSTHEGIPLSILEAMAVKKPVIAAKVGGIPEVIIDAECGWLVDSRAPDDFAKIIIDLIHRNELRISIGENARKRVVSIFSDTKMMESYLDLYNKK